MELSLVKATTDERTTYIGFEFGRPLSIGSACTGGDMVFIEKGSS
jgi:hypothetical protein